MKHISKKERISQLEAQLREKDCKIHTLEDQLGNYQVKFELMQTLADSKPDDCKPGEYCKVCSFSKIYTFRSRYERHPELVYLCNKAGGCQHFVEKENL